MKDKSLEELEKMVDDRKWLLIDWLNSGNELTDDIKAIADETELILIEIEMRKSKPMEGKELEILKKTANRLISKEPTKLRKKL